MDQIPHFPTPQPGILHRALTAWWWVKAIIMTSVVLIIIGIAVPFILQQWTAIPSIPSVQGTSVQPSLSASQILDELDRTRRDAEVLRLRIIALGTKVPPAVRTFHLDHARFAAYQEAIEHGTDQRTLRRIQMELTVFRSQMHQIQSFVALMERR